MSDHSCFKEHIFHLVCFSFSEVDVENTVLVDIARYLHCYKSCVKNSLISFLLSRGTHFEHLAQRRTKYFNNSCVLSTLCNDFVLDEKFRSVRLLDIPKSPSESTWVPKSFRARNSTLLAKMARLIQTIPREYEYGNNISMWARSPLFLTADTT